MVETHRTRAENSADLNENGSEIRTPRTIRFSDSEWHRIKSAAIGRGISIGGYVRDAALARSADPTRGRTPPISPGIEELLKQTFRYVCIVSTLKRNQLIRDGHGDEVDKAIEFTRRAEAELLSRSVDRPPER